MLLKVSILLSLVGLSWCAAWQAPLPEIPEKYAGKKGCYIEETDEVVDFGATVKPVGYCYTITCGEKQLAYISCGVLGAPEPCYITEEDLTKAYPECCSRVECPPSEKKP